MGLDGVEIVLEIENTFAISITDDEASKIKTPGQLHDLVMKHLSAIPAERCLTAAAFYRLRRGLSQIFGLERRGIRPDSLLDEIIPRASRRLAWRELQSAINLELPDFEERKWASRGDELVLVLALPAATIIWMLSKAQGWPWYSGLVFAIAVIAIWISVQSRIRPPAKTRVACITVGSLAEAIAALNRAALAEGNARWTGDQAWQQIRVILAKQLNVPLDRITRDVHLVKDLGLC